MPKYTAAQKRILLAHELKSFDKFMHQVEEEDEELFHRYVYRLLLKVYELHLAGRHMTKMQACRLIPLRHQNACQRYVDEAKERGFIEMRPNAVDRRKIDIIPKQQLLNYVEEQLDNSGDNLRITIASAAGEEEFPADNLPLSRWKAPA